MASKRLLRASQVIDEYFAFLDKRVFKRSEISQILTANLLLWNLSERTSPTVFLDYLQEHLNFEEVTLVFPAKKERRYAKKGTSPLDVALSLKTGAYLSHHTAATLHGLVKSSPNVYINKEQPPKRFGQGTLTQERIDLAFRNSARVTNNKAKHNETTIWLLNGMHTGNLGVVPLADGSGGNRPTTNLERTLIDMAVRPAYSGGVSEVLSAYKSAAARISVIELTDILRKLAYVYPYHQAVGFYLDASGGYKSEDIEHLRALEMTYDFYLTHRMGEEVKYSPKWRLFYPHNLLSSFEALR